MLTLLSLAACTDYTVIAEKSAHADDTDTSTFDPGDDSAIDSGPPPTCVGYADPLAYTIEPDPTCEIVDPPGTFTPVIEWQWSASPTYPEYAQVMMAPVVIDVSEDGTPDVVFITFGPQGDRGTGVLRAIDGASGSEHWALKATLANITGTSGIGAGDADGDGHAELYMCAGTNLLSVDHLGVERWIAPGICTSGEDCPSLHDMEGDGTAEIVVGRSVLEPDGSVRFTGTGGRGATGGYGATSFGADVDGDGLLEVIAGNTVYRADGSILWGNSNPDGEAAIADFELDGVPDIVVTTPSGLYRYNAATGEQIWGPIPQVGGGWGGAPTIADFDGDGLPEIGVAELTTYVVRAADGSTLWAAATHEGSVAITGSSVFDFEGDGAAEVLYADELTLWVLSGVDGSVKLQLDEHASATVSEYPLAVDVDGDDAAEIVLASNNYYLTGWTGITVIGDASDSWVNAGSIWNQHAFHQSHIAADGSIPTAPLPSWEAHNTFRAGDVVGPPTSALPDLAPGSVEVCADTCSLGQVDAWFAVESQGTRDAGEFLVALARADGSLFRAERISGLAAGSMAWLGPFPLGEGEFPVRIAIDDDGSGSGLVEECDERDNVVTVDWPCE